MKCEECLPRIEEYVDGELDGRTRERMETHLLTCPNCTSELEELRREQEVYANYRRDIEVAPAHWNIVRARIEQERDASPQTSRRRLRERFREALVSRRRLQPAFVAAIFLIVVGISAGVIYLNFRHGQDSVASGPPKPVDPGLPVGTLGGALPPVKNDENREAVAREREPENNNPNRRTPSVARNTAAPLAQKKTTVVARLPRSEKPGVKQPTPDGSAQLELAMAGSTITGMRRNEPEATGDLDFEIARHAERAELLLRSFRNVRLSASTRSLDVSYEKGNARKLLYQNIALRRDAATSGDQSAAEVLNMLEPILLDIANLPDRAKARDVRSIEQRMEKKEIVATLQVRTLVASN